MLTGPFLCVRSLNDSQPFTHPMEYIVGIVYSWELNPVPLSNSLLSYLEALDKYIDYDENGNLRKCLIDEHGNRLRDKDGNEKTLRHKFAVYCDDIAAGANTLEELYELFEALLCCCAKAGIQVKAAKVKFAFDHIQCYQTNNQ